MGKIPCIKPDLDLMLYGKVVFGCFATYPENGYPRKIWWKFWERERTREEFLRDEHEVYMAERQCHTWNGQDFHFCDNN